MNMGQKIKDLRIRNNMTLEELGNKVGVGKSTVRKWENGIIKDMKRDKIKNVADALGVSPAYLMGWEDAATEENADLLPDILADSVLMEYVKKIYRFSDEQKRTIFDYIDYLTEKKGR
jgi:transcriptional regulator with XRE-family HTH domain